MALIPTWSPPSSLAVQASHCLFLSHPLPARIVLAASAHPAPKLALLPRFRAPASALRLAPAHPPTAGATRKSSRTMTYLELSPPLPLLLLVTIDREYAAKRSVLLLPPAPPSPLTQSPTTLHPARQDPVRPQKASCPLVSPMQSACNAYLPQCAWPAISLCRLRPRLVPCPRAPPLRPSNRRSANGQPQAPTLSNTAHCPAKVTV